MNTILYSHVEESSLASLYKRRLDHFNAYMNIEEEVEIKTLDDFCNNNQIKHIHFLKLDVEGNELMVLSGSSRMIDSGAIDYIQFEFGGCNIDSRTFFQDFYYFFKNKYEIYLFSKDNIDKIIDYKEEYEVFNMRFYLAKRIGL